MVRTAGWRRWVIMQVLASWPLKITPRLVLTAWDNNVKVISMLLRTRNLMRKHLDQRLGQLRPVAPLVARPETGWIRSIRQSLGMTAAQLAQRMGVSQPRIIALERAEATGAVELKTLQRAAEALNCRLVYAFVPNEPLEQVVRKRAHAVAVARLAGVEHAMRLENQGTSPEAQDERLKEATDYLAEHADGSLWAGVIK
jgi:predicted DNA-binding mobile mystery protein A